MSSGELNYLLTKGKITEEDLYEAVMQNKVSKIRDIWDLPEPSFAKSQGVFFVNVPASIQKEYATPAKVYGKTKNVVVNKVYALLQLNNEKPVTISEAFYIWLNEKATDGSIKKPTIAHYEDDFMTIADTDFVKRKINSVTSTDVYTFFKEITRDRRYPQQSFANVRCILNGIYDMAVIRGWVDSNVVRITPTKGLKFKPAKEKRIFSREEYERLRDYLIESDDIYDLALTMQLCTGCRIGEIRAICWEDVDLENKTVYIHRQIAGPRCYRVIEDYTKSGLNEGNRVIPLNSYAVTVLKKVDDIFGRGERVFLYKGNYLSYTSVNNHLRRACDELGIPFTSSHKIRATVATEAAKSNMDPVTMMAIFGWSDIGTAKKYISKSTVDTGKQAFFDSL